VKEVATRRHSNEYRLLTFIGLHKRNGYCIVTSERARSEEGSEVLQIEISVFSCVRQNSQIVRAKNNRAVERRESKTLTKE
jgi:hypothetical protein